MDKLLQQRLEQERRELLKYSKYIFNGNLIGFLFMMSFIFVYYYIQWLQTITAFQGKLLITIATIIIMAIIIMQKIIVLAKPADIVFLSSREQDFKSVFRLTRVQSLLSTISLLAIINLILLPIFTSFLNSKLFVIYIAMQFVALMSVRIIYERQFYQGHEFKKWYYIIIYSIVYAMLVSHIWFAVGYILILVMSVILLYFMMTQPIKRPLNWELMITYEQQRKQRQYQMLALFVDIPQLAIKVHRRKYFDGIVKQLSKNTDNMYYYLFVRSFFRQENTIFLIGRLMIFTMLLMAVFQYDILIVSIAIMASYLILIQLRTLIKQYDYHLWFQIYPQSEQFKMLAFKTLMRQIMMSVIGILTVYTFIILTTKWYVIIYILLMLTLILWLEKKTKE